MDCVTLVHDFINIKKGELMKINEFKAFELAEELGKSKDLTDREKHLIGIAVSTTRGCIACSGGRIKEALKTGVPYETIIAGIDLASAVNGVTTAAIATQGADLEKIENPCTDGACTAGVPKE